jgi:hypothetical protein
LVSAGKKIAVDSAKVNSELFRHIKSCAVKKDNVVETLKAAKHQTE